MSEPLQRPVSHLLAFGTQGLNCLSPLLEDSQLLGVTPSIGSAGANEFNLQTLSQNPPNAARWGVVDTSVSPQDIRDAFGNDSSLEISLENAAHQNPLTRASVDRMFKQILISGVRDPQVLAIGGTVSGHFLQFEQGLTYTRQRSPHIATIAWSGLPAEPYKRIQAPSRIGRYVGWQRDQLLLGTYLTDNDSPLVRRAGFTLPAQDRFCIRTFAGLLGAQRHVINNPSLREVTRAMATESPFIGMSFASGPLASVHRGSLEARFYGGLRRFPGLGFLPERGMGDDSDLLQVAKTATETAMNDPDCRAVDDPIDLRRPCFALYLVPLPLAQRARWERFATSIRTWLGDTAKKNGHCPITPVFIAGPGVPDPRYLGSYWLQVSLLYPLSSYPQAIRTIAQETQGQQLRILHGKTGADDLLALVEEQR